MLIRVRVVPCGAQIIMGGGQEARDVTTTAGVAGKFEVSWLCRRTGRASPMGYLPPCFVRPASIIWCLRTSLGA